jgi:hypothetical protein
MAEKRYRAGERKGTLLSHEKNGSAGYRACGCIGALQLTTKTLSTIGLAAFLDFYLKQSRCLHLPLGHLAFRKF